jgi:hypothetical protein
MEPVPVVDDLSILAQDELWRRIPPWHLVPDYNLGRKRISSAAFHDDSDGSPMSVDIAKIREANNQGPGHSLAGLKDFGLAAITAGLARQCGQIVHPEPEPENPAHAHVIGKKKSACKRLQKGCTWVLEPPEDLMRTPPPS